MSTPQSIGDYQLVRSLGRGAQGEVHVAVPPARLGLAESEVALKVFTGFVDDAGFDRATNELAAHAGLGSAFLLRVLDVGLQDSTMFLATELVAGHAQPGEDDAATTSALSRAARGAHELHEAGVVHGGVKPANLMLAAPGVVLAEPNLADVIAPGQTVTGVGPQGGIQYFDPTVLSGQPAGRASDIWALGVTLHELLTGVTVHPQLDPSNTMGALRTLIETDPVISEALDPRLAELIGRCVSLDRTSRPPTALALAEQLDALAVS